MLVAQEENQDTLNLEDANDTLSLESYEEADTIRAEERDTSSVKEHSPHRASVMSALLPGLGQIYNRKYWKVPLVWGGVGTGIYFSIENNRIFRNELNRLADLNRSPDIVELNTLDGYRQMRDISYIATMAIYLLNIVDAAVDAHLYHFDVGEDLSLNVKPTFIMMAQNSFSGNPGLSISLNF